MTNTLAQRVASLLIHLADGKQYSGSALAQTFNVSRATIANWVQFANEHLIAVRAVKGQGYQLNQSLNLLEPEWLAARLNEAELTLRFEPVVESTNQLAKQLQGASRSSLITAEGQLAGRGRRGRSWFSGFGQNLCFTLVRGIETRFIPLSAASLVVALSVVKTLAALYPELHGQLAVKWPNDIYLADKKLAGILIELQGSVVDTAGLIIGIGINVHAAPAHMLCAGSSLLRPSTCLQSHLSATVNRNQLLLHLTSGLMNDLKRFECQGFSSFQKEWSRWDWLKQRQVSVIETLDEPNNGITGTVVGISGEGGLVLELAGSGQREVFYGGEVSVVHE